MVLLVAAAMTACPSDPANPSDTVDVAAEDAASELQQDTTTDVAKPELPVSDVVPDDGSSSDGDAGETLADSTEDGDDGPDGDAAPTDAAIDLPDDTTADVDTGPPGPFCGDNVCTAETEDATSCVVDCGGNEATWCMRDRCAADVGACLEHAGCISIFECLLGCDDESCAQQCYLAASGDSEASALMSNAVQCGQAQGCFTACGNGTCGDGEDAANCPKDCGSDCVAEQCPTELSDCDEVPGCSALIACWSSCDSYDCQTTCIQGAPVGAIAAMGSVQACAESSGCVPDLSCGDGECADDEDEVTCPQDCEAGPVCGDGVCDITEDTISCPVDCPPVASDSCVDQCGNYEQGAPCQCDNQCPQYKDCCQDAFEACGLEWCGDGVCTANETFATCPEECEAPPAECGNDVCEPGEDMATCPSDCTTDVCGDGQCTGQETALNCSQDCFVPCLQTECSAETTACIADAACGAALTPCAASCAGEPTCISACGGALEATPKVLYQQVLICATPAGCSQ